VVESGRLAASLRANREATRGKVRDRLPFRAGGPQPPTLGGGSLMQARARAPALMEVAAMGHDMGTQPAVAIRHLDPSESHGPLLLRLPLAGRAGAVSFPR
jgi:hypothetical protein